MPLRSVRATSALASLAAAALVLASGGARAQSSLAASPLTLADVVALAKERAPSVHAAFARVGSAEAAVDRSRAARLPTISAQAAGSGFATNGQVYSGGVISTASSESYAVGSGALIAQWNAYDFGRTGYAVDATVAGVTAAKLSAQATEQAAMADAAIAFFTLLADDDLIRAAEAARGDRAHVVEITHHLVEGGYRSPVDETRARIALDVAELDLTTAKAARENDSVTLAAALQLDPQTAFTLVTPAPVTVDVNAAGDGNVAVRARRDVAAASARVDQALRNVTSAKRAHLPVLSVSASGQILYAHDAETVTNPAPPPASVTSTYDGPTELVQGSVTLTVPIFDPTVHANVRAAEASLGEARADLEQISVAARSQALQAAHQARSARVLVEQSERLAAGTAANLAAVEDRYANGMEPPLSLLDAQREDARARVAIVRAKLGYDVAAVKLLAGLSRADVLLRSR